MTNQRWKRLKVGKFGRVSVLRRIKTGKNKWMTTWIVHYLYLDGMEQIVEFGEGMGDGLGEALESQRRFLAGGKP